MGIYKDVFGLSISTGMVCKAEQVVSCSLEKPAEALKNYVQSAKTEVGVHADETGFKEQGKKMWAWVAIYTLAAVFIIRKGRTKKVAQELLASLLLEFYVQIVLVLMIGCHCFKGNFAGRILREIFEKFRRELECHSLLELHYWYKRTNYFINGIFLKKGHTIGNN